MGTPMDNQTPGRVEAIDASAVINEHMIKFAFPGDESRINIDQASMIPGGGRNQNRSVLNQMREESGAVRELFQVRSLHLAESAQERVVGLADQLDIRALARDARTMRELARRSPAGKAGEVGELADRLSFTAASPFIERARLGAIQLRQGEEDRAEHTFGEALKVNLPAEAMAVDEIARLHDAVFVRHEELKVKRSLPELFEANIEWIDSSKDGKVDRGELREAAGHARGDITASTLVRYLSSNYDNIDHGSPGIDFDDVKRFHNR